MFITDLGWVTVIVRCMQQRKYEDGGGLVKRRKTGQLPVVMKSRMTPGFGGMRRFHRQKLKQSGFLWFNF
jgi:hypothetical protein